MTVLEQTGLRLLDGGDVNLLAVLQGFAYQGPLTALAGGGRPNATKLQTGLNEVGTVGTAADSSILPSAQPGTIVLASNADSADSMTVYAVGSDTINATAGATGVALAAGKNALYFCAVQGKWRMILSA